MKTNMLTVTFAALSFLGSAAFATDLDNLIQRCEAQKSEEETQRIAQDLQNWTGEADAKQQMAGGACLTRWNSQYWFYSTKARRFVMEEPSFATQPADLEDLLQSCEALETGADAQKIAQDLQRWTGEADAKQQMAGGACLTRWNSQYWFYSTKARRFVMEEPSSAIQPETPANSQTKTTAEKLERLKEVLSSVENGFSMPQELVDAVSEDGALIRELTEDERSRSIAEIKRYVSPIPAELYYKNRSAYEALSILDPDDTGYVERFHQYDAIAQDRHKILLRSLRKTVSDFDGQIAYDHPNTPKYINDRSDISLRLMSRGGAYSVAAIAVYVGDRWLFVREIKANIDGTTVTIPFSEIKRDNNSEIWEYGVSYMTPELRKIYTDIAMSDKTVLRFVGDQRSADMRVSNKGKIAITEMLWLYDNHDDLPK